MFKDLKCAYRTVQYKETLKSWLMLLGRSFDYYITHCVILKIVLLTPFSAAIFIYMVKVFLKF